MTGRTNRIVVGLDGSAPARHALEWAVREAVRRGATVLVVTAWAGGARASHDEARHAELVAQHVRLAAMQREAIAQALAGAPAGCHPVIGREIILAEPVTALAHAGRYADLLVLGSDASHGLAETSVAGRVARRFARRHGGPCPLVVIPSARSEPALVA